MASWIEKLFRKNHFLIKTFKYIIKGISQTEIEKVLRYGTGKSYFDSTIAGSKSFLSKLDSQCRLKS